MPAKNARAYLVRVWLEPGEGGGVWRASLTDLATRQAHYFTDYLSLLEFLGHRVESTQGAVSPHDVEGKDSADQ